MSHEEEIRGIAQDYVDRMVAGALSEFEQVAAVIVVTRRRELRILPRPGVERGFVREAMREGSNAHWVTPDELPDQRMN